MKITIKESRPGEFRKSSPGDLQAKIALGARVALSQATGISQDDLIKAVRGGEMEVVEELAQQMADIYRERTAALVKALDQKMQDVLDGAMTP